MQQGKNPDRSEEMKKDATSDEVAVFYSTAATATYLQRLPPRLLLWLSRIGSSNHNKCYKNPSETHGIRKLICV